MFVFKLYMYIANRLKILKPTYLKIKWDYGMFVKFSGDITISNYKDITFISTGVTICKHTHMIKWRGMFTSLFKHNM